MDKEQFKEFFITQYPSLCAYAYRFLLDRDQAEDLVQEVFIRFWNKLQVQEINNPRAYIKRAVYNSVLNHVQSNNKRLERSIEELSWSEEPRVEHLLLEAKELEAQLEAGIQNLPHKTRQIFEMSRGLKMTYPQIADQTGLSVKSVERHISTALKRLKEFLGVEK